MTSMSLYYFGGRSVWLGFVIGAWLGFVIKVSRKKANVEAENRLRDRSYCWRVLSDQVRASNIVFAIVGNTGIVFWGVANDRPITIGSLCLPVLST